jgi:hypothetical protein
VYGEIEVENLSEVLLVVVELGEESLVGAGLSSDQTEFVGVESS